MTGRRKSPEELAQELREQVQALRASCIAFDKGDRWEAKRVATSIYLLVHDGTGRTKSLLGQTGHLATMKFLSTYNLPANAERAVLAQTCPLLWIRVSGEEVEWVPAGGNGPHPEQFRWLAFSRWWEECIFHPISRIKFTRKNIVHFVRSQDGGAHVDAIIQNDDYLMLKEVGDETLRKATADGTFQPIGNAVWPLTRQLGWELNEALLKVGL